MRIPKKEMRLWSFTAIVLGVVTLWPCAGAEAEAKTAHKSAKAAKVSRKPMVVPEPESVVPAYKDFPWMTDQEFEQAKEAAETRAKKRTIASSLVAGEDLMSEKFKAFRTRFLAIKSAAELDGLLNKLDTEYDTYPEDLKLAAVQLVPLRTMKALIYRMTPLYERNRVTHSMLLTMVRQMAANLRIYLPTEQWEAGFAYVTEPFSGTEKRFTTQNDLQTYLTNEVAPQLVSAANRLQKLQLAKPVVLDNKFFYGTASFQDNLDRYRLISQADKNALSAGIHFGLSWIALFRAYDMEELVDFTEDLGRLYGIDGFDFFRGVEGAPAARRVEVLRKGKYSRLFTLSEGGQRWMGISFKHLKQGVQYSDLTWREIKERPANDYWILDPAVLTPFSRGINSSLKNLEAMLNGPTDIRSAVTGEVVTVDLPGFFSRPPADLKAFLPIEFDKTPKTVSRSLDDGSGNKTAVQYNNYFAGRPTNWDISAYAPYFPSLRTGKDVAATARIMAQSWGAGLAGGWLWLFVQ